MKENDIILTEYNDSRFDKLQMQEIQKGLAEGLDVSYYALPEISYQKMCELREGMLEGINLSPYKNFQPEILHKLRIAYQKNLDIGRFVMQGYDAEQLEQIMRALELNLNIEPYLSTNLRAVAIQEICEGLQTGMDVSLYASDRYNWQQMREIRLGLEHRMDVSVYSNPMFDFKQMREIRTGMEIGLDVSSYASLMYTDEDMKRLRLKQQEEFEAKLLHPEIVEVQQEWFTVTISEDEMQAYLICNKCPNDEASRDELLKELNRQGVTKGIDKDAIEQALTRGTENKQVVIATGQKAEDGQDGWYEFFFRTEMLHTPKQLENGRVDYQNIEWFETVNENQKLAYYHKAGSGKFGYTVAGALLKPHKGKELPMLRGSGYILQDDGQTYVSAMNGRVEYRDGQLNVSRMFEFNDITLATGNVNVDGNVHIKGQVGSKTTVRATGDIVIDGFVEAAVIESGGNIVLRNGVNAGNQGRIYAKEKIVGRFFETAIVSCDGDIHADYSMDSQLSAKGSIVFSGAKGLLIGGRVEAQKGLTANSIGNSAGSLTVIQFGTSRETRKLWKAQEERIEEVKREIGVFTKTYQEFQKKYTPEVCNGMELYIKLENAIYTKENELKQLRKEHDLLYQDIKESERAEVKVKNYLYEGVLFESNGVNWKPNTVYGVKIKKDNNQIVVIKA